MKLRNDFGSLDLECKGSLDAGSYNQFELVFRPADDFIVYPRTVFDVVLFTRFFSNQWSLPQICDPTAPGFVIAKRTDGGFVDVTIKRVPSVYFRHGSTFHSIQITVGEKPMDKGSELVVIYGYKGGGSPGVKAPLIKKKYFFPVYISQRHVLGGSRFMEDSSMPFDDLFAFHKNVSYDLVKDSSVFCPEVTIYGGEPDKLRVVASPRGNNVRLTINILDSFGNLAKGADCSVIVGSNYQLKTKDGYGTLEIPAGDGGIRRIKAECPELGLYGISNPVSSEIPVLFGEIHCHSSLSDGLGTDEDNYLSALNAGLDFGGLSDHDTLLEKDEALWEKTVYNAEEYNDEPLFASILGYELLTYNGNETAGHINFYYSGEKGEMIPRPQLGDIPEICRRTGALAIPHHTMYGGQFFGQMGLRLDLMDPKDFSENFMPVVEIYSTHGNSEAPGCERSVLGINPESSVISALDKGFKWGFIGGSDNHESLLGHAFRVDKIPRTINNEHMQFRHGLTAVFSKENTRKSIFDAVKRRSVYATTGERILLYVEINGTQMGNELALESGSENRCIEIIAAGTSNIERIDIIRNGITLSRREPGTLDCEVYYVDEEPLECPVYYYVKVVQKDGEMAWSSPIWINLKK